jgi:hypothetical protein
METSIYPRPFVSRFVVFAVFTALPFAMNALPQHFANAFSEHNDRWNTTSLTLMAASLAAWSWATVRLGRAWRPMPVRAPLPLPIAVLEMPRVRSPRLASTTRWLLIFHGPILVALFYLMWLSARLSLGRWPYLTGRDDPALIPGTMLLYGLICGWFWFGAAALAAPLFRLGRAVAQRAPTRLAAGDFALTAVLLFAALGYLSLEPHGLMTWFRD